MSALPLARLFGFEIRVHVSWAIILAVIAVTVATQIGSMAPATSPILRWSIGAIVGIAFLLSALAHELGHALAARRAGAPGRVIVVFFFGGAAGPTIETATPRTEILAALAGPLVSLVIGGLALVVSGLGIALGNEPARVVAQVAFVIGILNVVLGVVNLLPAFPLDGGRVARAAFWARTGDPTGALRSTARIGRWIGIAFAVVGVVFILTMDSVDGLMLALCGWFLVSSGRAIERTAGVDALLRSVRVRDVMDRDVRSVPSGLTLDTFAEQVLEMPGGSVPVTTGSDLVGVLGERQVRRVKRDRWAETRASDVMTGTADLPPIDPDMDLRVALDQMLRSGVDGLPVFESGALVGLVTRGAVARVIRDQMLSRGGRPGSATGMIG